MSLRHSVTQELASSQRQSATRCDTVQHSTKHWKTLQHAATQEPASSKCQSAHTKSLTAHICELNMDELVLPPGGVQGQVSMISFTGSRSHHTPER
mmetsp:Transcript_86161/g.139798  ORF Transcript_86161/g.139798 Transcript_86161/m.139798 type:complete len:96 (+) Transcript_86161:2-289(+)